MKTNILQVKGVSVATIKIGSEYFISLTDIARNRNPEEPKDVVKNWMRSKTTIEFLGLWEQLNNPDFKGVEFDSFMFNAGSNAFTLSPSKWIETTNAKGLFSRNIKVSKLMVSFFKLSPTEYLYSLLNSLDRYAVCFQIVK